VEDRVTDITAPTKKRGPGWWLGRFFATPWRVVKLKRRAIAQRGTIIDQRARIKGLEARIIADMRDRVVADAVAVRRERNKLSAENAVAARLHNLQAECDGLAETVLELRRENALLKLQGGPFGKRPEAQA
jgi:hypothetical protein